MASSVIALDDLVSETLRHRSADLFAPPGLTNFLGVAQVDNDPMSIRSVTFPPFSTGDAITARAYIGGRLAGSYGGEVAFTWRADRVVRESRLGELDVRTTTVMVPGQMAVVVQLEIANRGAEPLEVPVRLVAASRVTRQDTRWNSALAPDEGDNELIALEGRPAVCFRARHSPAAVVQGVDRPAQVTANALELTASVRAGETWRVGYVLAVGGDVDEVVACFDRVVADVPGAILAAEGLWQRELDAMFTPGNDSFGGHLPVLETDNDALRRLYYMGALGVLYFRRDSPYSVVGRAYDTLMPRYWASVTFIWDYFLSTRVHALLDPEVMRRHLERWMASDTHTHLGTDWLTGQPIGYWYSINDLAMTRMMTDYVAYSGNESWFDALPAGDTSGRTVLEHFDRIVTAYRELTLDHGLADYGGIDNLLECVSSYIHAVASLNAGNVWSLRKAAGLHEHRGDAEHAASLRKEADELAAAVNTLYVEGSGHFAARYPDGTDVPVKHCLDFFQVLLGMHADLTDQQRTEMADFFVRELQTPLWMQALSPADPDAVFSVRPDHQWNGAYPAWPAESALALLRIGRDDIVGPWLEGLAASTNQGPLAQAHFAESAVDPDGAGARKAPPDVPWVTDWTCSSSGSWVGMVIDGIFGVDVAVDGTVTAIPRLTQVDPGARLVGLRVRGVDYDVDASGARPRR
ncbi:MAG: hypothetical protein JJD92_02135 [Frankiaceae bacterium]|nr:hypothetical protein [Frankiaceae bacterium]